MARTPPRRSRRAGDGPDPVDVQVGSRIRQRRNLLGISQEKLAAEIGVTFQQVQKYERGGNRVGAGRLYRLAKLLGVEIGFFFREDDPASATGFAEPSAEGFDADPLNRSETKELVNAYLDIPDPALRRRFLELARALAASPSKPRRSKSRQRPASRDRT